MPRSGSGPRLVAPDADGRRHAPRKPDCPLGEIAFHDPVDQTSGMGICRLQRFSRDAHVERLRDTNQPWQPLRTLRAGNDAEIDFRLAEQRIGRCDSKVPRHRDFEPATERRSMDRHDYRLGAVLDPRQQRMKIAGGFTISPRGTLQSVDVGAGDEGLSRAHDHDGGDRRIALRALYRFGERRGNAGTESVHWWVIDGDDRDTVANGGGDWVGHG